MNPNFRIIVIDDEKIVCDRLSMELERAGFEVEAYGESAQALQRVAAQHFDLVITDMKMRGPDGMEVLKFIQEHNPSTKVIVITGFATEETAQEVMTRGAVEFIPKPFKMSQLRELVLRLAAEKTAAGTTKS
jgi:DNA-binding NtrC family response regulator